MRSIRLSLLGCTVLLAACTQDEYTFVDKTEVEADRLMVISSQEADYVDVAADRITVPLDRLPGLQHRQEGDVLASDRGSASGTNPVGFLRRFKSSSVEGDRLVVLTEPAALTDVVRSAQVQTELSAAPVSTPKGWSEPVGQSRAALEVDKSIVLSLPSKSIPLSVQGKQVPLSLGGELKVNRAHLKFDPSFDLGLNISWFKVDEFHAVAKGDFASALDLEGTATLTWDKSLTDKEPADEIAAALKKAVESNSGLKQSQPLWSTSVPLPTWFVGPVPVVTDLNFGLELECKFSVQGSVTASYAAEAQASFAGGIRYAEGRWEPVNSTSFHEQHKGPDFTVGGGVGLECGLKPTLQLRFYGAIGPYVFMNVYAGMKASLSAACGDSAGMPECSASVTASAGAKGGVGAKVDIGVMGVSFKKDMGEIQLFDVKLLNNVPIAGPLSFGKCPLGSCSASPSGCGNGTCEPSEDCVTCEADCGSCSDACGDASCGSSESCTTCPSDCGTCTSCSWGALGEHGDPCPGVPEGTWRCVYVSSWQKTGSQVCRSDASYCGSNGPCWISYHLNPADCGACCGDYSAACD